MDMNEFPSGNPGCSESSRCFPASMTHPCGSSCLECGPWGFMLRGRKVSGFGVIMQRRNQRKRSTTAHFGLPDVVSHRLESQAELTQACNARSLITVHALGAQATATGFSLQQNKDADRHLKRYGLFFRSRKSCLEKAQMPRTPYTLGT